MDLRAFGWKPVQSMRASLRKHPTPGEADNDIAFHQYQNEDQRKFALLAPTVEKSLNFLTNNSRILQRYLHPQIDDLVGADCPKEIATSRTRPKKRRKIMPVYGLVNEDHIDIGDKPTSIHRAALRQTLAEKKVSRSKKKYSRAFLDFDGFCLPTTCAYRFLYWNKADRKAFKVKQLLSMDGLGLAMDIVDGTAHHFLGASFRHCTCLCLVARPDGSVSAQNYDDSFLVFAWGANVGIRTQ